MLKEHISPQIGALESLLRKSLLADSNEEVPQLHDRSLCNAGGAYPLPSITVDEVSAQAANITSSTDNVVEPDSANTAVTLTQSPSNDSRSEYSDPETDETPDDDGFDSDEDIEVEHTLAIFSEGREFYARKSYAEAESILRICLNTAAGVTSRQISVQTIKEIQFYLSLAYLYQEKWDEALEILYYLPSDDPSSEGEVLLQLESLIALAKVCLAKRDFDSAIAACKQVRSGSKRVQGKSSSTYIEACRLLVLIHAIHGDFTASKLYNTSLSPESCLDINVLISGLKEIDVNSTWSLESGKRVEIDWLHSRADFFWYAAHHNKCNAMWVLFWIGVDVNCVGKYRKVDSEEPPYIAKSRECRLQLIEMGACEPWYL